MAEEEDLLVRLQRERKEGTEAGEYCRRCGKWIFCIRPPGYPRTCYQCERMKKDDHAVSHDKFIRCPKCGASHDPYVCESFSVFEEGMHSVTCPRCDHDFEVETSVSFSFESPEREPDADDEDSDAEEATS
jgi:hypothetical protein